MPRIALADLETLAVRVLERAGANPVMAATTARALVHADAEGLSRPCMPRSASDLRSIFGKLLHALAVIAPAPRGTAANGSGSSLIMTRID
jgi:hypothetical protein